MKKDDVNVLLCPKCRAAVALTETTKQENGEIVEGKLACTKCQAVYPIVRTIPRFVPESNYADSFGFQWNQYAKTQIGGKEKEVSKMRWDILNKWRGPYDGQKMLECGCGAGRFSEIALETGVELYSFDLSIAVEAARENVAPELRPRRHLYQASLYAIPLPYEMFDKVYCMGVLQHTPDVKKSFMALVPHVKPGGELAIDCYLKEGILNVLNPFQLKYWVRWLFFWWPPKALHAFLKGFISVTYDLKRLVNSIPLVGGALAKLIPIGPLRHFTGELTVAQSKEIKTLTAMDVLGARYDKPQSFETVRQWASEAGLEIIDMKPGFNGINALMRKPLKSGAAGAPAAASAGAGMSR